MDYWSQMTINGPKSWQLVKHMVKDFSLLNLGISLALELQVKTSLSSLGKVAMKMLPGKRQITWVLAGLLFPAELQMESLAVSYDTRP